MVETAENISQPKSSIPVLSGDSPGGLKSVVSVKLQTFQAHKLVSGRRGDREGGVEAIVGLLEFGRRMKLIWLSAEQDDPYADWFLLEIETLLDKAKQSIEDVQSSVEEVMASMEGLDVQIAETESPVTVRLQFNNPYGYRAAYLLLDYDKLVRSLLTARHIGLVDRKVCDNKIRLAGGPLRHIFFYATRWRFTGVIRRDVELMTQNAKKASDLFGDCPDVIFKREKRAKFAPPIKNTSAIDQGAEAVVAVLNGSDEASEDDMYVVEEPKRSSGGK